MSIAAHKAIASRFGTDLWGRGDLTVADDLFAPDLIDHNPLPGQEPGGEGAKQVVAAFRAAFPDLQITNDDLIAEGDKVVLRWTATGTHQGELMGLAATGKQVRMTGIDILKIEGGKIVERWGEYDALGLMQQLTAPPQAL